MYLSDRPGVELNLNRKGKEKCVLKFSNILRLKLHYYKLSTG